MKMNEEQLQASIHGEGPMLVLAGPGTGKTATLAARYKHLISKGIPPESILSITFTKSAAIQLRERLSQESGINMKNIMAGTFHAVASGLIKAMPEAFPMLKGRRMAEEEQSRKIAAEIARKEPVDESDALARISAFKDTMINVSKAKTLALIAKNKMEAQAWVRVYENYELSMQKQGLYDFSDLIFCVVEGIKRNPTIRSQIANRWSYLMVDEYQDINAAQEEMIGLLLGTSHNLWAVGDDDQALYGWRQADVQLLLDFSKRHPGAKIVLLKDNYRCPPIPLQMASRLIVKNKNRYPKILRPTRPENGPVILHEALDGDREGKWVANEIKQLIKQGVSPNEIAVLARTGSVLGPTERGLRKLNIPCRITGAPPFWQQPCIKIGLGLIQHVTGEKIAQVDPPPRWMIEKINHQRRTRAFEPVAQMVCRFLEENCSKGLNQERRASWKHAIQELSQECIEAKSASVLSQKVIAGRRPIEQGVHLSTIHAAKGLEWHSVFIIGLESGILPSQLSEDTEEERRLAYVALTRTRNDLFLSYATERLRKTRNPSPFLQEMLSGIRISQIKKT